LIIKNTNLCVFRFAGFSSSFEIKAYDKKIIIRKKKISMKIYLLSILFICNVLIAASQSYSLVGDDVDDAKRGYVGIEWYGLDAGFGNTGGAFLFTIGANTYVPITDILGVQAALRTPLFRLSKGDEFAFQFDGGVDFLLKSKTVNKEQVVTLSYKERENWLKGTLETEIKYVKLTGDLKKDIRARGGAYLKNTYFETESNSIFHKGVYAGISSERTRFFRVLRKNSDADFVSANIIKMYADVMILPTTLELEQATAGGETELTGLMGWRVGVNWNMSPFHKSQNHGDQGGFFGNMLFGAELGSRPLEKIFITGSVSYLIRKF